MSKREYRRAEPRKRPEWAIRPSHRHLTGLGSPVAQGQSSMDQDHPYPKQPKCSLLLRLPLIIFAVLNMGACIVAAATGFGGMAFGAVLVVLYFGCFGFYGGAVSRFFDRSTFRREYSTRGVDSRVPRRDIRGVCGILFSLPA